MDSQLKIAVVLSAIDNMSQTINAAVNGNMAKLNELNAKQFNASNRMFQGQQLMKAGEAGFNQISKLTDAYGTQQAAALRMKSAMMQDGGVFDQAAYEKLTNMATSLSNQYTGSTADYIRMVTVLRENGIGATDTLNGIGEATAKLSVLFDNLDPASIAQFAARMKNDVGIQAGDMTAMMDVVQRLKNAGVGKDGAEAVTEMNEAFSKVGLGMSNLHVTGLQAAQSMSALMGIFIRRGISGQTVGNNFRRIFDGLRDAEKMQKANEVAAQFGKTLAFYDKDKKFLGIENFVAQIGKLKGLDATAIGEILKPFSGKQGLSTDFLEFLANDGTDAYKGMMEKLSSQADLNAKVATIMESQLMQQKVAETSMENAKASFGETISPMLTKWYVWLNKVAGFLTGFAKAHPAIAKMMIALAGIASAILFIAGAVLVFSAAWGILGISSVLTGMAGLIAPEVIGGLYILAGGIGTAAASLVAFTAAAAPYLVAAAAVAFAAKAGYQVYERAKEVGKLNGTQFQLDGKKQTFSKMDVLFDYLRGLTGDAGIGDADRRLAGAQAANINPAINPVNTGGTNLTYSPNITVNGSMSKGAMEDFKDMLSAHSNTVVDILKNHSNNQSRLAFD